jgi:HMG box factor, other
MVMTIPYINKIKVLSKISPPLAPPGPTSPVQNVRGAVIAVEGADYRLVAEVGSFIQEYLSKEPECLVKTWPVSGENLDKRYAPSAEMTSTHPPPPIGPSTPNTHYLAYLRIVQSWHHRSTEIKTFITTPAPSPTAPSASTTAPSPTTVPPSCNTNPPPPPPSSSTSSTSSSSPLPQLPIALLPTGFSLSLSDAYASAIPITDAYAPVDHWQWMATLWRGVVGPDLTVYVKALDLGGGGTAGGDREAAEEMVRHGGVECRWDVGAVVVRVGVGGGGVVGSGEVGRDGGVGGGRVEEKTLRRLGFEVLEWVRGGMGGGGGGGRAGFGKG